MRAIGGYALIGFAIAVFATRYLHAARVRRRIPQLLRAGAQIVDVRSPAEYAAGHAARSRNIPLEQLERRAGELDKKQCVILCCASGTRSAIALGKLRRLGFEDVQNAGSWRGLQHGA